MQERRSKVPIGVRTMRWCLKKYKQLPQLYQLLTDKYFRPLRYKAITEEQATFVGSRETFRTYLASKSETLNIETVGNNLRTSTGEQQQRELKLLHWLHRKSQMMIVVAIYPLVVFPLLYLVHISTRRLPSRISIFFLPPALICGLTLFCERRMMRPNEVLVKNDHKSALKPPRPHSAFRQSTIAM